MKQKTLSITLCSLVIFATPLFSQTTLTEKLPEFKPIQNPLLLKSLPKVQTTTESDAKQAQQTTDKQVFLKYVDSSIDEYKLELLTTDINLKAQQKDLRWARALTWIGASSGGVAAVGGFSSIIENEKTKNYITGGFGAFATVCVALPSILGIETATVGAQYAKWADYREVLQSTIDDLKTLKKNIDLGGSSVSDTQKEQYDSLINNVRSKRPKVSDAE
jgi:hypothetical protein